ncbi:MAG: hypothetical protein NC548_66020, partial [Lachnospiraceae bacterium]|nr:hypothetical protein [Lachnospiraceae bacterium]
IVEVTDQKRSISVSGKEKPVVKRYSITDDLHIIDVVLGSGNFCLTAPISYAGKERGADNARFLYAIAVDVDDLIVKKDGTPQGLIDLWNAHIERVGRIPKPTMIVSSGTGLHLYYVFEKAVPLYPNIARQLQKYKHELTRLIWNEGIVNIKTDDDIQYEGIYQGFRMPGTITKAGKKDGTNERARAFVTGGRVSIEYMNGFVADECQVTEFTYKSKLPLAAAKEKYPEWYERRIENHEKGVLNPWHVSRRLYDWWKGQILSGARVKHRYWCLWVLAVYAKKCSFYDEKHNPNPVTREELERDAWELMEHLESLTDSEDNHFTEVDVIEALEAFEDSYISYPKNSIRYKSGIPFEPQVKRRKKPLKQSEHLEEARAIRDIRMRRLGKDWRKGNGRPKGSSTSEQVIKDYLMSNPFATKKEIRDDTGLSYPTIRKYYDQIITEINTVPSFEDALEQMIDEYLDEQEKENCEAD